MHRGVAPRAIAHVFSEVQLRIETHYEIVCTYCEIYNERIFDLLRSLSDQDARQDYAIVEEKGGRGVFVRGLTEVPVESEAEALNLLYLGQLARTTAQHKLNRNSNRSHSIFCVTIRQQSRSGVSERVVTSKLNLVDLAGSERLKKTMEAADGSSYPVDETMKKESMYINQSLTYLEQCVVALGRRSPQHVAYRQTKLTSVLKDALGGNCATLLFGCMWGEASHLEETVSTLRLASRMMRVQNTSTQNAVADPVKLAKKQELVIRDLRRAASRIKRLRREPAARGSSADSWVVAATTPRPIVGGACRCATRGGRRVPDRRAQKSVEARLDRGIHRAFESRLRARARVFGQVESIVGERRPRCL